MLIHIPLLDTLLLPHARALGGDFDAYRNHACRVLNLAWALCPGDEAALQRLTIAAAFHDLGIWTARSFDYLAPSIALARAYLEQDGRGDWTDEVSAMIAGHHKITTCAPASGAAVEAFRRADWADVSFGLRRQGIARELLRCARQTFPIHGFHCVLARLALRRLLTHPLNPLPMVKW